MEPSDYGETCTSDMAYYPSQISSKVTRLNGESNQSVRVVDLTSPETCTSEMAYYASQETNQSVRVVYLTSPESNQSVRVVYLTSPVHRRRFMEECHRLLMLEDIERKRLYHDDPHLSEEVNVLRQMLTDLRKYSVAYKEMSQYISEVIENTKRNQLMEKFKLFIFLLAFLLHSGNDDYKHLATPERGKISCITVYLLGNDGAHSYNGNGIFLTTRRQYTRFNNEIRPDLPLDVLQRQPTDKEISKLSWKIGKEYRRLAYELGITRVQLDHLIEDNRDTEYRIQKILFLWRDGNGSNATFETLVNAMVEVGINPGIVCQSLERA